MAKRTTDKTIRLEKQAKAIEAFIESATSDQLRSMLSSISQTSQVNTSCDRQLTCDALMRWVKGKE